VVSALYATLLAARRLVRTDTSVIQRPETEGVDMPVACDIALVLLLAVICDVLL
jgi:hypothetical protein